MKNGKDIVYLEDLDAKMAYKSGDETIYYCPYCLEREIKSGVKDPKPDRYGKLYINMEKKKGICFRCGIIIQSKDASLNAVDTLIANLLQKEKEHETDPNLLPPIDLKNVPYASEVSEAMEYLRGRNPAFSEKNVKFLDLRWVETHKIVKRDNEYVRIKRTGILVPLKYKGQYRSYQIRYVTDDKKQRFHTMSGIKIIYTIGEIPKQSAITICEGVFSAIALLCLGFPNVVALLGKTPSKLQLSQLKELCPCHINLCLDSPDLNYALLKTLKKNIRTLETWKAWRFPEGDPEDFYKAHRETFKYSLDHGVRNNFVKKLKSA